MSAVNKPLNWPTRVPASGGENNATACPLARIAHALTCKFLKCANIEN